MTEFVKRDLIQASNFPTLKRHNFICKQAIRPKFQSYKCNDGKVLLPNFKAEGQTQAELHVLKFEKLDACIRSLFANSVTYTHCTNDMTLVMITIIMILQK